jgi:RNA polymerase sigma-70 factor, ECF subfamily
MGNEISIEITRRLKEGDEKAFEIIFHAYYGALVNFSDEYLHDREASRNIVQTVFMKLWEKRDSVMETESLKSYLYTLTRNESISYLRHLKVSRRFTEVSQAAMEDLQLNQEALESLDFSRIDLGMIEKVILDTLETMPERCREVFILSRYEGLKNQEIASKLDISLKAVEGNITRALRIFRFKLRNYMPESLIILIINRMI